MLQTLINNVFRFLQLPPSWRDAFVLTIIAIIVTYQPYLFDDEIKSYELGLYLPGIEAVLEGKVLYRDIFHLRGPLEVYLPALMMKLFGIELATLYLYFYIGTVATIIATIWVGKELFQAKWALWSAASVIIVHTFPRIFFRAWGGFRYLWPLLALLFVFYYVKTNRRRWLILSALMVAASFLTSIEMGVCALALHVVAVVLSKNIKHLLLSFVTLIIVLGSYAVYLISQSAFSDFCDIHWVIITELQHILGQHNIAANPSNFTEVLSALLNPLGKMFRYMTPSYVYIAVALLFFYKKITVSSIYDKLFAIVFVYGGLLYILSFRNLTGPHFEMLLQPEKLVLIGLAERLIFYLNTSGNIGHLKRDYLVYIIILGVLISSVAYTWHRATGRRFPGFKMFSAMIVGKQAPLPNSEMKVIDRPRLKYIRTFNHQADDIRDIVDFISKHTQKNEPVWVYFEYGGAYNFFMNRPWVGRFGLGEMSALKEEWHQEYFQDVKRINPRFVVTPKEIPPYTKDSYFVYAPNREKYNQLMNYINEHYEIVLEANLSRIYKLKEEQ